MLVGGEGQGREPTMSSAQAATSRREEREKTKTHVATQGQPGSTGTNTGTVQLWTFYPNTRDAYIATALPQQLV